MVAFCSHKALSSGVVFAILKMFRAIKIFFLKLSRKICINFWSSTANVSAIVGRYRSIDQLREMAIVLPTNDVCCKRGSKQFDRSFHSRKLEVGILLLKGRTIINLYSLKYFSFCESFLTMSV